MQKHIKIIGIIVSVIIVIMGIYTMKKINNATSIEVTPTEDLMREHGLLNRVLLVYETCIHKLKAHELFDMRVLLDAADIIKSFIEDYHEKNEEQYLFPIFEKTGTLVDEITVLREQHVAGRKTTRNIITLTKALIEHDDQLKRQELIEELGAFIGMYRPHEAREDTEIFPLIRSLISAEEFEKIGEIFEESEEKLFGKDGYSKIVHSVEEIEKALGIFDLAQFTPRS